MDTAINVEDYEDIFCIIIDLWPLRLQVNSFNSQNKGTWFSWIIEIEMFSDDECDPPCSNVNQQGNL